MNKNNDLKLIGRMVIVAVLLLSVAILTINSSFALSDKTKPKTFDVRVANIETTNMDYNDIAIRGSSLLFNVLLDSNNRKNSFVATMSNEGNITAVLNVFEKESLDKEMFTYNGVSYKYSDFIYYTVTYAENNKANNIIYNTNVKYGDSILLHSSNKIEVVVRFKYDTELNEDLRDALNSYLSNNNVEMSLYLNMLYGEK